MTIVSSRKRADPAAGTAIAAAVGPASLVRHPHHVEVGDGFAATFAAIGYPAELGPAFLEPILSYPGRLDVSIHIDPMPAPTAAAMLRRQRARFESTRRLQEVKGRLNDPMVDAAADDAADLAARVARGSAKLFDVGVYLTVHATTHPELVNACARVRSAAASTLIDLVPVTWRHDLGWVSTLPLGVDNVGMRRVFDTDALAAAFPLASNDLPGPLPGQPATTGGVLYGMNTASPGLVWWDRWQLDNFNSVVLARSGAGKSYQVKLEVLRSLYNGITVAVIDPEDEYTILAHHVGGTVIRLGAPGVRVNPLDLSTGDLRPDTLTRRATSLHSLVSVMLDTVLTADEHHILNQAILACYATVGITMDSATWTRPAPLLRDLAATLHDAGDPVSRLMAARLAPWTEGTFKDLFDGPTTTRASGHLVVWSLRNLPDELRTVATALALNDIWDNVDRPATRGVNSATGAGAAHRLVVVDEAWLLMRTGAGANFLSRMAKQSRKRGAGLCVVTQDAADLLATPLGMTVVSNAATQILLRQAPQAIDAITDAFALTAGEARMLLTAGRGHALLVAGSHRVAYRVVASPQEHRIASNTIDESTDRVSSVARRRDDDHAW